MIFDEQDVYKRQLQTCFKLQGTDRTGYDYFNLMIDPLADVNQATTDVLSYFDEMYANNKNFHVSAYNMASDLGMINTVLNLSLIHIFWQKMMVRCVI